jgi:transcriptional regulator with XRE-family HTH domain
VADRIDIHVGKRLRRRRKILGITQECLGETVGCSFQQVQKHECGANRINVSRLYDYAVALSVPIQYFFEGLPNMAETTHSAASVLQDDEIASFLKFRRLGREAQQKIILLVDALTDPESSLGKAA